MNVYGYGYVYVVDRRCASVSSIPFQVYTKSLLTTLNARKAIRRAAEGIHTSTVTGDEDEEDENSEWGGDDVDVEKRDEEVGGISLGEGKLNGRGRVKMRCQEGGGGQGGRGARSKVSGRWVYLRSNLYRICMHNGVFFFFFPLSIVGLSQLEAQPYLRH
ncbi:hypothetical protein GYMLUDRAFT_49967 [Collybiopsis luxurians FD-317 M1]|uniref:Uncharacterized protein n=1 Tax=Collybiopsis luxurians FD-317 M1 TaxID=944289 RepID=A0A0D0C3F3_9AGAR|nr:hypothetical protein GYMLUDRAFT_49967 [Collybiopsis luxurians FD-317 M1]